MLVRMLSILEEESHLQYHVPTDHPLGGTSRAIAVEAVVRYLSIYIELLMLIYFKEEVFSLSREIRLHRMGNDK
jgi:hypothetical protein